MNVTPGLREETVMVALRTKTRDLHERVEESSLMGSLLCPSLCPERYVLCLDRLHAFHAALELSIEGRRPTQDVPRLAYRRKSPILRRDLLHFSFTPDYRPTKRLDFRCDAEAWGALYVIEGATLGGNVISKHLRKLAWLPPDGRRFFSGYGDRTGHMWSEFCRSLVIAADRDQAFIDSAVSGARATFLMLAHRLDGAT